MENYRKKILEIQEGFSIYNKKMAEMMEITISGYTAKKHKKRVGKRFTETNFLNLINNFKKKAKKLGI